MKAVWKASGYGLLLIGLTAMILTGLAWENFGRAPQNLDTDALQAEGRWENGAFLNSEPMNLDTWGSILSMFDTSPFATPSETMLDLIQQDPKLSDKSEPGLRILWLGHSTCLIDIDGHRILTDPIFDDRASPWSFMGPAPWFPAILDAHQIPGIDAVIISHDHYDHLSKTAVQNLRGKVSRFIVPLGVDAHLQSWGIPESSIQVLDWWSSTKVGSLTITATPGRHASGRSLTDQNRTLWMGVAIQGPTHRVYFSGDTGWTSAFQEIGKKLGPFHVTMIDSGAYHPSWPDWHLGPEWAAVAHRDLRGEVFIPIHWGRFTLAPHGWTEPAERARVAGSLLGVEVALLRPGVPFTYGDDVPAKPWWPNLPWDSAQLSPIPTTTGGVGTPLVTLPHELQNH